MTAKLLVNRENFASERGLVNSLNSLSELESEQIAINKEETIVKRRLNYRQWFYDLPIRRKQLVGLFTSEVISVVGLVGVGACLIVMGGRSMLAKQAKSELAVTEINYNIKVKQMGFGFRGQSDNPAIIATAKSYMMSGTVESTLREQVRKILANEIEAREIEYATLVGQDLQIIVNANNDRGGETFNPNNLVSEVLDNPRQIETSEIVSRAQLAKESPPLPPGLVGQDALIRYTVTPVRDPQSQEVLGTLVSGDIVNYKLPIIRQTLATLGGGYSAVYLYKPTGEFVLATAGTEIKSQEDDYRFQVPLADASLLMAAVEAGGKPITRRLAFRGQTYTMAAKTLANFAGEPVAVLVRGTPETALNALLKNSLLLQVVVCALALAGDVGLAIILGRAIARPIRHLQQKTEVFSAGELQARAEVSSADEVGQLAATFNHMADSIVSSSHLEAIAREQALLNAQLQQEIAERQRAEEALQRSQVLLREKNQMLETALHELQQTQVQLIQTEKMSSLGQMVAGVAHEINNPVSFIYGNLAHASDYAQDLLKLLQLYQQQFPNSTPEIEAEIEAIDLDFLREDLPQLFKSMNVGTDRIREIVRSLKTFSRLDEADVKEVNIHEGIDSTLMILQNRLKGKPDRLGIEVIKEYGQLPLIYCYPGQLNQVFMNLLANAIDALEGDNKQRRFDAIQENPCTIRICTEALNGNWVLIRISDNGPGVPELVANRLYDPFFTTKPVGKGTGLGLSISHQIIVEKHGGKIHCHSSPGQGAEFVVEIPIRQQVRYVEPSADSSHEAIADSKSVLFEVSS